MNPWHIPNRWRIHRESKRYGSSDRCENSSRENSSQIEKVFGKIGNDTYNHEVLVEIS